MQRVFQVLIAIFVVGLTLSAARWAYAQAAQPQAPMIITGSDVGFKVDRDMTQTLGKVTGTWVVRVNGQWIEPDSLLRSRPLSTK